MSEAPREHTIRIGVEALEWLRDRTSIIPTDSAVFDLAGPGAVECLQGILSNDVARPGSGHLIYGALLTAKGMIVVDLWVFRTHRGFTVVAPAASHDTTLDVFSKRFPPRLVTITDLSSDWDTAWVVGAGAEDTFAAIGRPFPASEWHAVPLDGDDSGGMLGYPGSDRPGSGLVIGPSGQMTGLLDQLQDAGALIGGEDYLEAVRILGGWPRLGSEIGEKTLPQEVRLDQIGGVSHTKGCYVGQETVARIHFRGHPNRTLRGVLWSGKSFPPGTAVFAAEKQVGRLTSVLEVEDHRVGLSLIRHEVETGAEVTLGEQEVAARVSLPPFWEAALPE